jgi:hypothetical protein
VDGALSSPSVGATACIAHHPAACGRVTWLSDAMQTSLERNGDVVRLAAYAPLLANTHFPNWNPNAIRFDSARAFGTPSYWVQRLFMGEPTALVSPAVAIALSVPPQPRRLRTPLPPHPPPMQRIKAWST